MAYRVVIAGVDRTSVVRRDNLRFAAQAHAGQGTDSGFDLDDDAVAVSLAGLKVATLEEDASGTWKVLARSRIMRPGTRRGDWPMGDARQFQVGIVDSNWDLRRLRVQDWPRVVETDVARVQALGAYILAGAGSTVTNARKRATTTIDVTTYVPNTNTVSMPAKTYTSIDPWGVIDDCARASGKAWFVYVDDAGALKLFYDLPTSLALASTLAITDSAPDYVTSFPPLFEETGADVDFNEFLTGGAFEYGSGAVATTFDAAVEADHDVAEDSLYDSAADATDAAQRLGELIAERKVPEQRIRTTIEVPPAKAHLVKAGMMISFRSAACAVLTPTNLRVVRAEHAPPPGHVDGPYRIPLELGYPERLAPRLADRDRVQVVARETIVTDGPNLLIASCDPGTDTPLGGFPWVWTGGVEPSTAGFGVCVGPAPRNWGQGIDSDAPPGGTFAESLNHDGGCKDFAVTPGDALLVSITGALLGYPPPAAVQLTLTYFDGACTTVAADTQFIALGAWSNFDFVWNGAWGTAVAEFVVPVGAVRCSMRLGTGPSYFTGWLQSAAVSVRTPATGECYQESE